MEPSREDQNRSLEPEPTGSPMQRKELPKSPMKQTNISREKKKRKPLGPPAAKGPRNFISSKGDVQIKPASQSSRRASSRKRGSDYPTSPSKGLLSETTPPPSTKAARRISTRQENSGRPTREVASASKKKRLLIPKDGKLPASQGAISRAVRKSNVLDLT